MTTRIYIVRNGTSEERLVEATNAAQAIKHVSKPFKAELASQKDLVKAIGKGVKLEQAKEEDEPA